MPDLSGMGDLVVTVGGDISPLTDTLEEIPGVAQTAASQIQAAFDAIPSATSEVESSLSNLSDGLSEAGSHATEAAGHVAEMPPALHETSEAAHEAESSLSEFVKTGLELAGIALSLEALKEGVLGSLEAFAELQRADVALTAITKDAMGAKEALEGLPALADKIGASIASLEEASVKFARFGVDLDQLPGLFSRIADAALASGQSFDTVASAWERIDMTGKVMARGLMAAGVSVQDLSKALGLDATASIKDVSAAMSALGSGAERAAVLMKAVPDSVQGLAASADTVSKSFQQMSNAVTLAKEHIGEALAGLAQSGGMTVLKDSIKGVEIFVVSLLGYLGQAIDLVRGFASIAVDEFTALGKAAGDAARGNVSQAFADIKAGDEKMVADFNAMGQKMASDWAANGKIIDSIWSDTSGKINANSKKIGDGLTDTKTQLEILTAAVKTHKDSVDALADSYNKGVTSIQQLQSGITSLETAERALDASLAGNHLTLGNVVKDYTDYQVALDTAKMRLNVITEAYALGAADLSQYERALHAVKAAQDELNGSLEKSPADQVKAEFDRLQGALLQAKDYLAAVTAAMQTGGATAGMYQAAVSAVTSAESALTGTTQAATTAISSSSPKVIELGNAVTSTAATVKGFVGPIQDAGTAIQTLGTTMTSTTGITSQVVNGIQVLRDSLVGVATDAKAATDAGWAFANGWKSMADVVAAAAKTIVSAADQAHAATVAASQAAMQSVESLSAELDRTMAGPSEGGGPLGLHMSLKPGDIISGPSEIFAPPVVAGGTETGSPTGGLFGPTGPTTSITIDPFALAQQNQQMIQAWQQLNDAAKKTNTAAGALTDAATLQQTAAQSAYDAAKAATIGTLQTTTALSTAADQISASALAAADAANTAAFNNSQLVTSTMNAVNAVAVSASNTMVAAASVVTAVAQKAGIVMGTNTLLTPTVGPGGVSLPNIGPSGAMTAGLAPGAFVPAYQGTVGGTGPAPVILQVQGSQFVQMLFDEFVRNMQSQGIRLTRG